MNRPVVYIAGPFRAPTIWEIAQNVQEAEAWGLEVAKMGAIPLIPHPMYHLFHGSLPDEFWVEATLTLLHLLAQGAEHFAVLVIDHEAGCRWWRSDGTVGEVEKARRLEAPVFFVDKHRELRQWVADHVQPYNQGNNDDC